MSYECNLIVNYLSRNSYTIQPSKSSKSIYFYSHGITFRYSDHITISPKDNQIQVIRKAHKVLILIPGDKEYVRYNEKTGYYFLRRLVKGINKSFNSPTSKSLKKYKKWKSLMRESREIKRYLNSLSGVSKDGFKNYRL